MSEPPISGSWKAELRYGKRTTPYHHFTVIAEGVAGELTGGFSCRPGKAFMGMKVWASSADEAAHMAEVLGREIGFAITVRTYVYDTEPSEPPTENPRGYDIGFFPFGPSE